MTPLLFGEIKSTLKQASDGGCDDDQIIVRTNEAIPLLMGKLFFVGTVGEIKVQTFVPEFSLPFGYERALSLMQCECGDFHQGWYTVENAGAYIDPSLWGDSVAIDLGMRATERPILGECQILVQSDYNEDAGLTLRIYGKLRGMPQYTQFELEGRFLPREWETLAIGPESDDVAGSVNNYDDITGIIKPPTRGPVRILARDINSGRIYRIATLQPQETSVQRRWYKYPELVLEKIIPRCVYPTDTGFQIDTNFEQVPLCAGDSIVLSGWCPTQFNGLWTVAGVKDSSFYVTAPSKANWVNPGEAISAVGCCTKLACINVSASKAFIPIVDDNSEVMIQNRLALRMTIKALWAWDSGNVDDPGGYTSLLKQATDMLTEDVTRYGLDPTNTLNRKAAYKWEVDNFAPSTFGYVRARLALELQNGLRIGRTDLGRLLNEALELAINEGKWVGTTENRTYEVSDCVKVHLHPDVESILTAKVGGWTVVIGNQFTDTTTRTNSGVRNSGYIGSPFFAMSTMAGAGAVEPMLIPCEGEEEDDNGNCHRVYRFFPCGGSFNGCCVKTVVKLRYIPAKCLDETLLITNYAALKFIVEGLIKRELGDFGAFQALQNKGFSILDKGIRHHDGGAQGKVRRSSWALTRRSQSMR